MTRASHIVPCGLVGTPQTTLVVASNTGREATLLGTLDSVAKTGICEHAVVVWGEVPYPKAIQDRFGDWLTFENRALPLREVLPFVQEVAKRDGFAFWLRDDERVRPLGALPAPITNDLVALARPGLWVEIDYGGRGHPEPRLLSASIELPPFLRPTLFGLPISATGGLITVTSFVIQRVRERAPKRCVRLNLGCGSRTFSLWDNIDHDPECAPDHLLDLGNDPLPYADNSVEAIYFSHALDHLTFREGQFILGECLRVLRPGGVLRVVVCDLATFVLAYKRGTLDEFAYFQPPEFFAAKSQGLKLGMLACGGMSDRRKYSGHKLLMDGPALVECLELAGFAEAHVTAENEISYESFCDTDDIFPDHSVFLEGTKLHVRRPPR